VNCPFKKVKILFSATHWAGGWQNSLTGVIKDFVINVLSSDSGDRCTLVLWYGFIQTILKAEENLCLRNIEMCNSPSEWVDIAEIVLFRHIEMCMAIFHSLSLDFIGSYCTYEGHTIFQYCRKVLFPRYHTNSFRETCWAFQYCEFLQKCGTIFEDWKNWSKFLAINLIRLIALKLRPSQSKMQKKFLQNKSFYSIRGAVAHYIIVYTHIYIYACDLFFSDYEVSLL